jgi:RNA polymerase sigma-70 factor (sigma-E family)
MRAGRVSDIVDTHPEPGAVGAVEDPVKGSIEDLYVRYAPPMVRLAYLMTHDPALAEDLTQDAFVKVAGRFRHLRSPAAFEAYLRRTVMRLCLSHHRHAKVEREYLARAGASQLATGGGSMVGPDVETRDELIAALVSLPERQRAAVVLRFYEDLSEQQTADALGCSVTAARSLTFRAMETLRSLLGDRNDAQEERR